MSAEYWTVGKIYLAVIVPTAFVGILTWLMSVAAKKNVCS